MTRVFTGLAVALLGTVLLGSDAGPYDLVFEDLAPGVFVARRPDAIRLPVEGNVTVVIGDRGVVVMDAGGSPASARQVIAEIRRRTALSVRYLVNSHGHYDHVVGNHEFAKAFPGVEIIGGPGLRDYMSAGGLDYVRTMPATLDEQRTEAERSLAEIRAGAAPGSEQVAAYLRRWIDRDMPEQARQFREAVVELPTAAVGERLALDAGGRRVEVRHLGFGKSGSDLVLWLPDERIVAAGDTLTGPIPYGFSRKPIEWLATLRALAALGADVIVPGHGEVQQGGAYLTAVIDLVERARARVLEMSRQGRTIEGIIASIDLSADERRFAGDDPVVRLRFRDWFTEPFVDRVVREAGLGPTTARPAGEVLFADDFEGDLSKWELGDASVLRIVDSGDAAHGRVFEMAPAYARLAALIRGSDAWRGYRIEGDVLFPENVQNYLGFVYHYRATEHRVDLGSLYIKGNNSYVRVNPRRDWNPARQLYEEYRTSLTGADAIRIGEWRHFAAEVVGPVCHFYVGDMAVPKVTFDFYEAGGGRAGFKPRVVGGRVWLDNVRVTAIGDLSYVGPRQPDGIAYAPEEMITDWRVLGPLSRAFEAVEHAPRPQDQGVVDDGAPRAWTSFDTDPRGAVVTGRVTEFLGSRTVAYFHTTVIVPEDETARVEFSSIDDLALWLDGRFDGYLTRDQIAWHDAGRNPEHPPTDALSIGPGTHELLIRVRGGQYATGGFFARLVRSRPAAGTARVSTVPLSATLDSRGRLGGVSAGPDGALYVSNFGARVWRIDPDGVVTVVADDLRGSSGNTVDRLGRLLQASFLDNRVLAIGPGGATTVVAGEGLNGPVGLTTDEENRVYVCNCRGNSIARIGRDGRPTTLASGAPLDCPNGITRGPDEASYVVNFNNGHLVRVSDTGQASIVATLPDGGNAHVVFAGGAFFVTRIASNELWRVTPGGAAKRLAGTGTPGLADGPLATATLARPNGIAVSPDGRHLFVNNLVGPWRGDAPTTIVVRKIGPIAVGGDDARDGAPLEHIEIRVGELVFDALAAGPRDGELVLLLHGFPETSYAFRHQLRALARAGYRAVAPDERGYSPGARPAGVEPYAMGHLVSDVLGMADALGAERFHLVGHDWGGAVAWVVATRHPNRLRTLTVLSTPHFAALSAGRRQSGSDQARRSSYFSDLASPGAEVGLLADHAAGLRAVYGDLDQDVVEVYLGALGRPEALRAALAWYAAAFGPRPSGAGPVSPSAPPAITVPTLYVWSTHDPAFGREAARATADHVTGPYRFEVIEGVGHWLPELAPERVNELLLAWVTRPG